MGIIIGLIVGFVVLALLYGVLCVVVRKWPALIWIVGIGGGFLVGIASSWWIGAIVGFFLIGFLGHAESSDGHRCVHCGSYDTVVTKKENGIEVWQCNKCGQFTVSN